MNSEKVEIRYGLRHKPTGLMLTYRIQNTGCEDANDTECILSTDDCCPMWLVEDPTDAALAARSSREWFNSDYKSPGHAYEEKDLEIVKVTQVVQMEPVTCDLPSSQEYIDVMFKKEDPHHHAKWTKLIAQGEKFVYCRYDLHLYSEKKNKKG